MELHLRLPLAEACDLTGLPLATGKAILRRNPKLALSWRSNRRGRPTAIVNPAQLQDCAYQGRASVAARFAHRCRRASVNPAQVLWAIVNGSRLPDGGFDLDMIGDSMRFALDDDAGCTVFLPKPIRLPLTATTADELKRLGSRFFAGDGRVFLASAFIATLGGKTVPQVSRAFDVQLAKLLLRQSAQHGGKMPSRSFADVWEKLLAEVCRKPAWRRSKPAVIRCENAAGVVSVRFAAVPLFTLKLQGAAAFAGESREGDREASESGLQAAIQLAEKLFPSAGKPNAKAARHLREAFALMRAAYAHHGSWHPIPSQSNEAANALTIMRDQLGIVNQKAWPFLLAYWRRVKSDLLPPSASSVMVAFQMKSRARPGNGPRRRPKLRRRVLTLRQQADEICDRYCEVILTDPEREAVAEIVCQMMQLQLAGRDDSRQAIAQQMGFASAGTDFDKAFPRKLITEAARCLDRKADDDDRYQADDEGGRAL
jgi:hypothetical protein